MKRKLILAGVAIVVFRILLFAAMSDDKASTEANKIWGANKFLMKVRPTPLGSSNWTYRIGFQSPGCMQELTIVGEGFNTWDAAFAAMPTDQGVAFRGVKGTFTMRADVDLHNMTAPATLQFILDGKPIGNPLPVTGNQVTMPWDSTTVPDGNHVICSKVSYTDATAAKVLVTTQTPIFIKVKQ